MPLSAPNLDDRTFQDIVDEARTMIPRLCPEWTDHNVSDPGITLVELFAWMTETLLFRMNQVPERNYVKFLDLIGVKLLEPRPARADISFRLSASQPNRVVIPLGTEVATVRTETQEAISFTTDRDLAIEVATLRDVLVTRDAQNFFDARTAIARGQEVGVFADPPQEGNGIYIGHAELLAGQTVALRFQCRMEGVGVDPRDPPLVWEAWSDDDGDWVLTDVESDTTGGLNRDGTVVLHIPYEASRSTINSREACWVRCRVIRPRPDQRGYSASPQVSGLSTETIGGTAPASHGIPLRNIVLGRSDGKPNQSFSVRNFPLLPRREGETVEVEGVEGWEPWTEVEDFSDSGPDDPRFVCDSASGEIRFGPALRQSDGTELLYGRIPRRGAQVRFTSYRVGGGAIGNVGRNTLSVLKSSIPYVSTVRNRYGAQGGRDGETLDQAKLRAPRVLRSRNVAITPADFEACALAASENVARAHCRAAGEPGGGQPGTVNLVLIPLVHVNGSPVPDEDLAFSRRLEEEVRRYIEDRRPLTVEVSITSPEYIRVGISATVRQRRGTVAEKVEQAVRDCFYHYLHPTAGGPDGNGWPLERPLFASELMGVLQQAAGVDFVPDLQVRVFDPQTGLYGQPVASVDAPTMGILIAGACSITVTR